MIPQDAVKKVIAEKTEKLVLLLTTANGQAFLYESDDSNDYAVHDDICLIFSREMINVLAIKAVISVDGTFTIVPELYYQLYTICYLEENYGVLCV